jgi:carbamoyl-phosphate synthase large subunit
MQHIEEAGFTPAIHPACLPAVDIPQHLLQRMREYTFKLARALKVVGLMNIQFAIPRASVAEGSSTPPGGSETRPYTSSGKVYVLE